MTTAASTAFKAFLWQQAPIIVGLVVGTLAKFGRMMALDQKITAKHVLGHLLMTPALGVMAAFAVKWSGIKDPSTVAFASVVFAIAADNIVKYLAARAWKRFLLLTDKEIGEQRQQVQRTLSAAAIVKDAEEGKLP